MGGNVEAFLYPLVKVNGHPDVSHCTKHDEPIYSEVDTMTGRICPHVESVTNFILTLPPPQNEIPYNYLIFK